MPLFPSSHNFAIHGGNFAENLNFVGASSGIDLLLEASEPSATHDSAARYMSPRCHPGTREQYIEDIVHWAFPSTVASTPTSLMWMKGHAGVGKSAIAQTCVEKLKESCVLFAAFFFSFSVRDKPERLFPTIAYQLSLLVPEYRDLLNAMILHDRIIIQKSLPVQFMELILEPLQRLATEGRGIRRRFPIFIDGLDECRDRKAQFEIIQIVSTAASAPDAPPLCWAFFSRPDPHIEAAFAVPRVLSLTHIKPLPISRSTDTEIELYLRASFKSILQRRNMPPGYQWPSDLDIKRLVEAAAGLFNYAATAVRFIENPRWLDLNEPIQLILNSAANTTNSSSPFAEMDALYLLVLQRIPAQALPPVSLVLTFLCHEKSTLDDGDYGASMLGNCLGMSEMELRGICGHLSAVLLLHDEQRALVLPDTIDTNHSYFSAVNGYIEDIFLKVLFTVHVSSSRSSAWHKLGGSIGFFHKSFYDFLITPSRSGTYCVRSPKAYENLFKHCLDMLSRYEAGYAFKDSELVLTPGITSSASCLSFPSTDEFTNSLLMALAYRKVYGVAGVLRSFPSISPVLRKTLWESNHRKPLWIETSLYDRRSWRHSRISGSSASTKSASGASLTQICQDFSKLHISKRSLHAFKRNRAKVLSQISEDVVLPPIRNNCMSGVDIEGHGDGAIFVYWEIDLVGGTYRVVRCIDLAKGIEFFKSEHEWVWPRGW